MIPYHIYGHSKGDNNALPIVWLDSSDSDSYVVGSPELVTNGDFSNGLNGWTDPDGALSLNLGGCKITRITGISRLIQFGGYIEQNKTYKLSYDILENNNCNSFTIFTSNGYVSSPNTVGYHEIIFTRTDSNTGLFFANSADNSDITIDNISIKEVSPDAQEVTSIDNLGTLGGQFDLFGSVKFANNGFEAWAANDNISYDLLYPFLPDNSFTVALTINFTDNTTGATLVQQFPLSLYGNNTNYVNYYTNGATQFNQPFSLSSNNASFAFINPYTYGLMTFVFSYSLNNNNVIMLRSDGTYLTNSPRSFNNTENAIIYLLNSYLSSRNLGKDNPLHEFRLYNKSFTLTEMQELQIELNNKYL